MKQYVGIVCFPRNSTLLKFSQKSNADNPIQQLGLIEMTRRRNRESLGHILCTPCPLCNGRGHLKSIQTICSEIYRRLLKESKNVKSFVDEFYRFKSSMYNNNR